MLVKQQSNPRLSYYKRHVIHSILTEQKAWCHSGSSSWMAKKKKIMRQIWLWKWNLLSIPFSWLYWDIQRKKESAGLPWCHLLQTQMHVVRAPSRGGEAEYGFCISYYVHSCDQCLTWKGLLAQSWKVQTLLGQHRMAVGTNSRLLWGRGMILPVHIREDQEWECTGTEPDSRRFLLYLYPPLKGYRTLPNSY